MALGVANKSIAGHDYRVEEVCDVIRILKALCYLVWNCGLGKLAMNLKIEPLGDYGDRRFPLQCWDDLVSVL